MAINSHIQLPALILRNFRDESDSEKKVWYLDLSNSEIRKKPASDLGTSKDYFSKDIERFWGESVETPLGLLNQKIRSFYNGEVKHLTISPKDIDTAKLYLKSAIVRSNLANETMVSHSIATVSYTDQKKHGFLSVFGMNSSPHIEQLLDNLSVTIIINRTNKYLVVPRNCYYCISKYNTQNFVIPLSPTYALFLLPEKHLNQIDSDYFEIDAPSNIDILNTHALKYEYMFNCDFIASIRRDELEFLQNFQQENLHLLEALKSPMT